MNLTPEEKVRWKPRLQRAWDSIAYDAIGCSGGECSQNDVLEWVLDADRAVMYGDLTHEENRAIHLMWRHPKTGPALRKWLKAEVFVAKSYVR